MATTTDPTSPAAGEAVTLTTTTGDADLAVYSLTSIPNTSALALGKIVDAQGARTDTFTPDVAGEYAVSAFVSQEVGGGATGTWIKRLGIETATIHVGGYLEMPIVPVSGHSSVLRLLVVNNSVATAALVRPATELARVAALDATVAAAVTALEGVAVNSLDVDFVTDTNTLCTKYLGHIAAYGFGGVHAMADSTNVLLVEAAKSVPAALRRLNDLASKFRGHAESGTAGGGWHSGGDDSKNTLQVAPGAQSLGEAVVLKADLRERCYRRHIAQIADPASHGLADGVNTIADPLPLPTAIAAYLDFVASNAPSIPAGEGEGIGDAQAAWGFRAV